MEHLLAQIENLTAYFRMTTTPIPQKPMITCLEKIQSNVPGLPERTSNGTISALSLPSGVAPYKREFGQATTVSRYSNQYLGIVTWTIIEKRVEDQSDDVRLEPDRRGHINLRVPFSSVQVNFHYNQSMGAPSYALNINHVIDPTSEVGIQFRNLMWGTRDLLQLKRLLSERKLSIYSLFEGSSLFYVSTVPSWTAGTSLVHMDGTR